MNNRRGDRGRVLLSALLCLITSNAYADTPGEARFFADCPHGRPVQLHDEMNPWDLHAVLYTTLGIGELEVVRVADWLIDTPLPGPALQPFRRTTWAIQSGYHRLPRGWLRDRVGEFVDAWQLAELSLGDAATTYSVATGSATGPGSGTVIRIHKLIDWTQHLTGDLNRLSGRLVGRSAGLVTWSATERAVDRLQALLLTTFHRVGVLAARTLEHGLTAVELAGEQLVNAGYRRAHQDQTVFLRLPTGVFRAHELWLLEHRPQLFAGTARDFARSTHAQLAHRRRLSGPREWVAVDRLLNTESEVVVMTTTRVMSRAPEALRAYVVPAAWVLNERAIDNRRSGL